MVEVVAVVDARGRQTGFAAHLSLAFAAAGFDLRLRTHRELVAEVDIEQLPGREPIVDPDRPLLWLSAGDADRPETPDGRFLASETLAAARSIAMLTRSPVLNRPSAVSICGALPPSPALAVRRIRHHDPDAAVRAERFAGLWPPEGDTDSGRMEVHDYGSGRRSYGLAPEPTGPFRRRAAVDAADLVKVWMIGERTVARTGVAPAVLAASRRIASGFQLDMATVWWLVSGDDGARTPARIDCWTWDAGLGADSGEVCEAVAAWMSERVERVERPAEVSR